MTNGGSVPALEFQAGRSGSADVAVDHIDLVVPPGLVFGLVGPNGAGQDHLFVDGRGPAAPRQRHGGDLRPGRVGRPGRREGADRRAAGGRPGPARPAERPRDSALPGPAAQDVP